MKRLLLLIISVFLFAGNALAGGGIVVTPTPTPNPNPPKPGEGGFDGGRTLTAVVGTFSADGSELTLAFEGVDGAEADITIFGNNGVIVSESVSIVGGTATIDTSSLTVGYYTITIEVDNGDSYAGEFEITSL